MPEVEAVEEPGRELHPVEDDAPEEEEKPLVGVFVAKVKTEDGGIGFEVLPQNVEVTEVDTILKLGLKSFQQALGLPE